MCAIRDSNPEPAEHGCAVARGFGDGVDMTADMGLPRVGHPAVAHMFGRFRVDGGGVNRGVGERGTERDLTLDIDDETHSRVAFAPAHRVEDARDVGPRFASSRTSRAACALRHWQPVACGDRVGSLGRPNRRSQDVIATGEKTPTQRLGWLTDSGFCVRWGRGPARCWQCCALQEPSSGAPQLARRRPSLPWTGTV